VSSALVAAARWLYGGDPQAHGMPPLPAHDPYVIAWCPSRRKRCRVGAVYAAPQGFVFIGLTREQRSQRSAGYHGRSLSLLASPDGTPLEHGFVGTLHCRCGQPQNQCLVPGDGHRSLVAVLGDVLAGRISRPGSYVASLADDPSGGMLISGLEPPAL
jgi:hypothetical protein